MDPARRLDDLARLAIGLVQLVVSAKGVGLEDPGIVGQMRLSMLAGPIARVVEHRRWRMRPAERTIVAHVNPTSPSVGLPCGQDRHSRVVAVQSLGRENVSLNPPEERCQRGAAAPHLIGQGRQAEGYALRSVRTGGSGADAARSSRTGSSPAGWGRPNPWQLHGTAPEPG